MKDLQKFFTQGKLFLDSYGIEYGKITDISINTRAKHRWGQTRRIRNSGSGAYEYKIDINSDLLADNISDIALMNTIVHEILHTVEGCFDHKNKWKFLADKITSTSDLTITSTASYQIVGLEEPQGKYIVKCKSCGKLIHRDRMSAFVKNPQGWKCGCCGGEFERIK